MANSKLSYRGPLISGNHRNQIGRGGKVYPSKEYAAFKKSFPWLVKFHGGKKTFFCGEKLCVCKLWVYAKCGDLDNYIKTIFDNLQGIVFKNDSQIENIYAMIIRDSEINGFDIEIKEK